MRKEAAQPYCDPLITRDQRLRPAEYAARHPAERISTHTNVTIIALKQTLEATTCLAERLEREIAPEAAMTLSEARRALIAVNQTLAADAPLKQDLQQSLKQMTRAADVLRSLADYLDRHHQGAVAG